MSNQQVVSEYPRAETGHFPKKSGQTRTSVVVAAIYPAPSWFGGVTPQRTPRRYSTDERFAGVWQRASCSRTSPLSGSLE